MDDLMCKIEELLSPEYSSQHIEAWYLVDDFSAADIAQRLQKDPSWETSSH